MEPEKENEPKEDKEQEMKKIRRRFKALLILLGVFLFLVFRDNRRQKKRLLDETRWLKIQAANPASSAASAASAALNGISGMGMGMGGMGMSGMNSLGMGGMGGPMSSALMPFGR